MLAIFMIVLGFIIYKKNKLDDFALGMTLSTFLYSLVFYYLSEFSTDAPSSLGLIFFGFYLFVVPASTLIITSLMVAYRKIASRDTKIKEVA